MFLDLQIPSGDLYVLTLILLLLIGLFFVFFGKMLLRLTEVEFFIGALAGGFIAYILLWGLNSYFPLPFWFMLLAGLIITFVGGLVGRGTLVMLLALFTSIVFVDAISPFLPGEPGILKEVIGLLLFFGFVIISGRFMFVFSAFFGGVMLSIALGSILDSMEEPTLRITQLIVALAFCAVGSVAQHFISRKMDADNEEILWVPTETS